ncbi:MAG: CBS domain-containing protein [Gammaproteobacteria bacterium]
MLVKQILAGKSAGKVIMIKKSDTVSTAAEILSREKIGAVIVSDDGNTVDGILSERDIVREIGRRGAACMRDSVADVMTNVVVGCHPGDKANSILEQMTDGRFRHMPVIENNKMIGVISIGDVVKARITEVESENTALTEMISSGY